MVGGVNGTLATLLPNSRLSWHPIARRTDRIVRTGEAPTRLSPADKSPNVRLTALYLLRLSTTPGDSWAAPTSP
jgi:hypothetical protein